MRRKKLVSSVVAIVLAMIVMAVCIIYNCGGAWKGGPASAPHLLITIVYIVFWSAFILFSGRREWARGVSFAVSLVVCIASVLCLIYRVTEFGGDVMLIAAVLASALSGSLFYGFRMFLGWTVLYAIAAVISAFWFVFALRNIITNSRREKMRQGQRTHGRSK